MSYRKIKVRTALDTVMDLNAVFDLSPIKSCEYDETAKKEAVNLHWFISNNCSVAFLKALKQCFADKGIKKAEP
jgi:hypothetical protein